MTIRLGLVALLFFSIQLLSVLWIYVRNPNALDELLVTAEAGRIAAALVAAPEGPELADPRAVPEPFAGGTTRAFLIHDSVGNIVLRHDDGTLRVADEPPASFVVIRTQREQHGARFLLSGTRRIALAGQPLWIGLAISGEGFRPFVPVIADEIRVHVIFPLVLLSGLYLLFNFGAVRSALKPLEAVMATVDRIDPAQVGQRIAPPARPVREVEALVASVNRMLARIEQSVRALQDFAADAAHELRTPLSIAMLNAGALPPGPAREALLYDLQAMRRLISQMLDMSHADALEIPAGAEADLAAIAAGVVADLAPLAVARGRSIAFRPAPGPLPVRGHADAIGRALRNLVENALQHGPPGSEVAVSCGPGAQICVRDSGPGIPPERRAEVLQRHRRLAPGDGGGAGLGLAIARTIMAAHRGRIEIGDAPGGGAAVRLDFRRGGSADGGEGSA
nr:HAMP domain-containing sensor histidine kinase [Mangrovicoccus sp. HB161399]